MPFGACAGAAGCLKQVMRLLEVAHALVVPAVLLLLRVYGDNLIMGARK